MSGMLVWNHAKIPANSYRSDKKELTSPCLRVVPKLISLGLFGPNRGSRCRGSATLRASRSVRRASSYHFYLADESFFCLTS